MSSQRKRKSKNRRSASRKSGTFDPHALAAAETWTGVEELIRRFATVEDPATQIQEALTAATETLENGLQRFDPVRLIEAARMAMLPIAPAGSIAVSTEAGAANLELLTLVALTASQSDLSFMGAGSTPEPQEMSIFVSQATAQLNDLLRLAQVRTFAELDPNDTMSIVSMLIQSSEIWIRNTSYPEMAGATNLDLLDGDPIVRSALVSELHFDAHDALAVLDACHDLQMEVLNRRAATMVQTTMAVSEADETDHDLVQRAKDGFFAMFEPQVDDASVSVSDVIERTGIGPARVRAVIARFKLVLDSTSVVDAVDAFATGNNPMRRTPLVDAGDDRVLLPHNALNAPAVRENIEAHLKTSPVWDRYAKHRGNLLEERTRSALDRLLPGAIHRAAFDYFVPATEAEAEMADPAKYTKRVEGDHLLVIDDVAIIVEDKAVALSALSRGGKKPRIRTDLIGIVTNAADQARRLRERIEKDQGLRVGGEGWVDLSQIREIHTIAVSLDDLSTVLTATRNLIEAGLVRKDNIPWTVSLHDLELIAELVDRPSEFLLYLRRRRDPRVTEFFSASDELDLFLRFYESGLWVEPDPRAVRKAFPFLPPASTAELKRYRLQKKEFVTSRTDALDRWFYSTRGVITGDAPKPTMSLAPVASIVDELHAQKVTGWLSVGATLLSLSVDGQRNFHRRASDLLSNPSQSAIGRTMTVPLAGAVDQAAGWVFIWATRPWQQDPEHAETKIRNYLRVKKHQLGIPRGVAFMFDEPTRKLVGAYYDGHVGPLDPSLVPLLDRLQPPSKLAAPMPPKAKRPKPQRKKLKRKHKKR